MTREASDLQAIKALGNDWASALGEKDIDRILTLVTDDVIFMPTNLPSIVGKNAVEAMYREFFAKFSVNQTFEPQEIQICGDWAFAWGGDTLTLVPAGGGEPIEIRARGMSIMRREADGSWKFARGINNIERPFQTGKPD